MGQRFRTDGVIQSFGIALRQIHAVCIPLAQHIGIHRRLDSAKALPQGKLVGRPFFGLALECPCQQGIRRQFRPLGQLPPLHIRYVLSGPDQPPQPKTRQQRRQKAQRHPILFPFRQRCSLLKTGNTKTD